MLLTTEGLKHLRADQDGVVSFEYIVLAACIVAVVIAVFAGTDATTFTGVLNAGFGKIVAAMGTL
jgi:pilus assembly protein Flp/PilA